MPTRPRTEPRPHLTLVGAGEARSDDALCRAFLAGDEAAFGALVRRHHGLVHGLLRRYTAGAEEARDLTQHAFLRAFQAARRALPRLSASGPIPFRAWLVRIAINLGKNQARQLRRWQPAPAAELEQAADASLSALDALEREEKERRARAAVLELPRRQREVLTLRVDGGLSFNEVAEVLGITVNNAKVHFHHAVKRLKAVVAAGASEEP